MSIQRRNSELVDLLRPDFVGNDGTASPTFTDEYLTGSHRQSASIGVRVYRNVLQIIGNNAWTSVSFTHQRWDDPDDDQWAIGTPTNLVCQFDGIYVIAACISWAAHATGRRGLGIRLNGATYICNSEIINLDATQFLMSIATTYKLVATDFLEVRVFQNSGGNLNTLPSLNNAPEFSMVRVA